MIPCETQSLSPLWSSFIQAPLLRSTTCFYWLWINNAVGSYNIDRDKLSTDCWDNKAILGLLCGVESCLWSLCYAWGGEGLSGFPSVNYTRPPWIEPVLLLYTNHLVMLLHALTFHKVVQWNPPLSLIRCGTEIWKEITHLLILHLCDWCWEGYSVQEKGLCCFQGHICLQ